MPDPYHMVAVPTYLHDEIERALDDAIAQCPEAEKDRETLRAQLTAMAMEYGVLPEFNLRKNDA